MERQARLSVLLVVLSFSIVSSGLFVPSAYSWTPLEGHITEDTTLMLANSPYRVINDVTVDAGVKLTIEPGVTVEFADGFSLIVNGTLYAAGTTDKMISFTSSRAVPSPGVWNTINFIGGKNEFFTIKYSIITYAKNGVTIATKDGYSLIEKSEIRYNSDSGIMTIGEVNSTIRDNIVHENTNGLASYWKNWVSGIEVVGNTISSNQENGVYLYSSTGYVSRIYNVTLSANTVLSNGLNGIYLNSRPGWGPAYIYNVTLSSNIVSSNGGDGIFLHSGRYRLIGYIYNVSVSSNTVSCNSATGIHANATDHDPQSSFDITVFANTVSANGQKAVWVEGSTNVNLLHNSISYNLYGVFLSGSKNNQAKNSDIYRNTYGMNVSSSATVNAEYNYWGNMSGPYHSSLNPEGAGNPVNGNGVNLDFIPYLPSPNGRINERPAARLTVDRPSISKGQTVAFDASASTDDERIDRYFFDFGDGKNSSWTVPSLIKYNYTSTGVYTASLTVMDNLGLVSNNWAVETVTVVDTAEPIPQPQPQQPDLLWIYIAGAIVVIVAIGGGVAFAKRKSNRNQP